MLPKRLSRASVYESPWVSLYLDKVAFPDGLILQEHHLLHFEHPGVGVVLENEQGEILLLWASRYATQREGWEIPAGGALEGETPAQAASREVLEETGYECDFPIPLYETHPDNGISDQTFFLFRAKALKQVGAPDPGEAEELRWFTRKEIRGLIENHEIHCGLSLTGLLLALLVDSHT